MSRHPLLSDFPLMPKHRRPLRRPKTASTEKPGKMPLKALQSILDAQEDFLVPIQVVAEKSKEDIYASARGEANRLIESLPLKGKELYEQLSGADASRRLGE